MKDLAPDRSKMFLIAGAIVAVIPLFISNPETTSENGHVTSYRDNVALGGGVLAILVGLVAVFFAAKTKISMRVLAALFIVVVGIYNLLRGLGKIQ